MPTPRPIVTPAARKVHLDTMEAVLIAEGRTLQDIHKAVAPLRSQPIRSANDANIAARKTANAIESTLEQTSARTRSIALTAIRAEFAVARKEAVAAGVDPMSMPPGLPGSKTNRDKQRSRDAAHQVHIDMIKRATKALESVENPSVADIMPDYAIDSLAATETVTAFHDERAQVERIVVERYEGTNWLPAMLKLWDATLDVATCRRCRALDDSFRPWGFDFAGGALTPLHNRCRCATVLIFSPLYLGRRKAAAA